MKAVACALSSSVNVLSTHCLIFAVFSSISGSSLYCFTYSTYSSEVPFKNRRTSSFIAGQMPQSGTQRQGDPHLKDLHQYIPGDKGCEIMDSLHPWPPHGNTNLPLKSGGVGQPEDHHSTSKLHDNGGRWSYTAWSPSLTALLGSVGREGPVSEPLHAPPSTYLGTSWGCVFASLRDMYFGKILVNNLFQLFCLPCDLLNIWQMSLVIWQPKE